MIKRLILLLILLPSMMYGQEESVMYTFDDCDGTDIGTLNATADVQGNPDCGCGVIGDALVMDGNNDRVNVPDTARMLFEDDYTVSFYFQSSNVSNTTDIFSFRTSCDVDSTLSIKYIPVSNSIRVEIAENFNNIIDLASPLRDNACWHHVTLTKFNLIYSLYIDGVLQDEVLAGRRVPFGRNAKIWIGNSPCLAFTEDRIIGKVDELEIRNTALSLNEVAASYVMPDRVITRDTTIFFGNTIQIETGPTCASSIQWNPDGDLDDATIADPTVTGTRSETYVVAFNDNNCVATDSVRVNVVDPNALQCEDLLLPKAFSPNQDNLNDIYRISNVFIIQDLISFEVFNRWGERVFITVNKDTGWDGSYNGQEVNPGMYIYKVKYTCENQEFVKLDNFTVLR
ncbi:MAG: T9SS type B sorting domain-containing protein [Saprospiraceae bacterium]|nr:T9SS type B sorting domain-containing protein [Saprospiraceae bacterium]